MADVAPLPAHRVVPIGEITPAEENPRKIPQSAVDATARSIENFGWRRAIVVNLGTHTGRPNEVLAGNHTLAGAKHLGWATVWGTTVDVTDSRARRIVAADNRTADLGDYDPNELADLLTAIQEEVDGLTGTGLPRREDAPHPDRVRGVAPSERGRPRGSIPYPGLISV